MREVEETLSPGGAPLWRHPEWAEELPWLVQGTTGAGDGEEPFDLGLFGDQPVGRVMRRWRELRETLEMPTAVHARQVHGAEVRHHGSQLPRGLIVLDGYDAHVSALPGVLMTVSVADCVPVFVADERHRAVAVAHAGWRGAAGGVLERTIGEMEKQFGSVGRDLRIHFGPSICGECYEVGPEVHQAVEPGREAPDCPTPIDLRAALAHRASGLGVGPENTTISTHCSLCGDDRFFSHRGGSPARQMGVIGVRG